MAPRLDTDHPITSASGFAIRDDEFAAVRKYLYDETGIALGDTKRDMVCSRLAKRLRHHAIVSISDYLRLVRDGDPTGNERQEFINCLTTNKTDFFREAHHFEYLGNTVIPRIRASGRRRLRIWSAGCSTGEEPYTLAMTIREHCPASEGWDVRILASDIDTSVVAAAERGVYPADRVGDVPAELLRKYFRKGTGPHAGTVAIRDDLRELIAFRRLNLMDNPWPVKAQFDVIFCRNVVIYFDRETQRKLFTRFAAQLDPNGYLFLGHSENLNWLAEVYASVGNTIYRPRGASESGSRAPSPTREVAKPNPSRTAATAAPSPEAEHTIILGDVKVTRGPAVIKTLLGSCVSACLFDPTTGIGGMNHFSLPGVSDEGVSARYGAHAMELLITAVMKQGGDRTKLRAKVFGGGKVLNIQAEHMNVGAKNAAFVLDYLSTEGIPIDGQSLGGTRGMVVRFHPHTGLAQAKPLSVRDLTPIVAREEQFGQELKHRVEAPPADDGITLF